MCPVCFATAAVIAAKAAGGGGVAAVAIRKLGWKKAEDRDSAVDAVSNNDEGRGFDGE